MLRHFQEDFFEEEKNGIDIDTQEYETQAESLHQPSELADKIVISVLDTGIGIKKADQKKLFKTFVCLKSALKMNQQGVGLGLCITKDIVEQFGGKILMRSEYGVGSRFSFSFLLDGGGCSLTSGLVP